MTTTADKILYATDDVFVIGDNRRVDAVIKFEIRDCADAGKAMLQLADLRSFVTKWGLEKRDEQMVMPFEHSWQGQADHFVYAHPSVEDRDLGDVRTVSSFTAVEVAELAARARAEAAAVAAKLSDANHT